MTFVVIRRVDYFPTVFGKVKHKLIEAGTIWCTLYVDPAHLTCKYKAA